MPETSRPNAYDTIGRGYDDYRHPDPRIELQIHAALGDAKTVCNVGAGTGSYEPLDRHVIGVEPSDVMIEQRRNDHLVVRATAEALPFADNAFDAALAVLTLHHWSAPLRGLEEMKRVSRRQVIFTFDLAFQDTQWIVHDYVPDIVTLEAGRVTPIDQVVETLGECQIETVPVAHDCTDGFQAAYWRRPERYLEPGVRASISTLAQLPKRTVDVAMQRLEAELADGEWDRKYGHLRDLDEYDFGYRLIISDT